ncbi:MAG: Stress responsive alpha-beta barrel domain protein [Armatimonadetes bacterium]|jgi:hypothetical protein|nr:Stress responsive alpha-beta barrel domain protein [Armatimonadota bacterium]
MVEHVVLFKTTPDATEEQRARMVSELTALKDLVPGIVDLSCGVNFSDRGQGFDIGLVVRFVDRAALEAYLPHPAHRGCVDQFVAPIKADVIVSDYEIG